MTMKNRLNDDIAFWHWARARQARGGSSWSSYWATRTPSSLIVTGMRNTEIDFSWTDNSAGDCSFSVYRSTDGVNYSSIGTTVAGDTTYTATGLTAGNLYYFRVVGVKSGNESSPTNVYDTRFKITIDTTKAGSANNQFVLPVTAKAAGSYFVDWGDGGAEETFTTTGNKSHTYAAAGTYLVSVRGSASAITFSNLGDKLKLIYIDNWGNLKWTTFWLAFYGCANMQGRWIDCPNLSTANIDLGNMFRSCTTFNYQVTYFNTSSAGRLERMFYECNSFNQSIAHFVTTNVQSFTYMLGICPVFKQPISNFTFNSATSIEILIGSDINVVGTTTNYDNTLIAWAAADVKNSLAFNGGASKYGEGLVDNGTTDGVAANKLIQSGQNFLTTVTIGDVIYNTTDGTYARVTAIDSDTQLSIDADIMASGEAYRIQHGDGAKARASLIIDDLWTITDGGYL